MNTEQILLTISGVTFLIAVLLGLFLVLKVSWSHPMFETNPIYGRLALTFLVVAVLFLIAAGIVHAIPYTNTL